MFPAHDKTWQFCMATGLPGDPNSVLEEANYAAGRRQLLFRIKQILVEELGWTVLQSCARDGSDWVVGNEDLWIDPASIVWGYSPTHAGGRSWIVLKSPRPDLPVELLVDCHSHTFSSPYERNLESRLGFPENQSHRVFVGVNATSAIETHGPTISTHGGSMIQWCGGTNNSPHRYAIHAMQSSDHKQQHLLVYSGGQLEMHWALITPERHQSDLSHPVASCWMGRAGANATYTLLNGSSTDNWRLTLYDAQLGGRILYWAAHGRWTSSNMLVTQRLVRDANTLRRPVMELGLLSVTADRWLWLGTVPDLYCGQQDIQSGTGYHGHAWHQHNNLILPGNGSPLVTEVV